jgi:hypothetical protein
VVAFDESVCHGRSEDPAPVVGNRPGFAAPDDAGLDDAVDAADGAAALPDGFTLPPAAWMLCHEPLEPEYEYDEPVE